MVTSVKGMNDIFPQAPAPLRSALWQSLLTEARQVLEAYGYTEVWIPVVEEMALFSRSLGESTDVVQKEMYTFEDRGGRALALRPEGTAGVARAYIEHHVGRSEAQQRWWYFGPMFRAERPQKGRYRQFYQVGAEFFGAPVGLADVEILLMLKDLCAAWGLGEIDIALNTLGDGPSRAAYHKVLKAYLTEHQEALCSACQTRLLSNPLRVLDCKRPECRAVVRGAPDLLDSLSPQARRDFAAIVAILDQTKLVYRRDPHLVRGLDYYTGLIFEITSVGLGEAGLGAQDALLGGGRYDHLVSELGGAPTQALGFAAGFERLAYVRQARQDVQRRGPELYLCPLVAASESPAEGSSNVASSAFLPWALALAGSLRQAGLRVEVDMCGGRAKHQLRRAERVGAVWALVVGPSEQASGRGRLKALATGQEVETTFEPEALSKLVRSLSL